MSENPYLSGNFAPVEARHGVLPDAGRSRA